MHEQGDRRSPASSISGSPTRYGEGVRSFSAEFASRWHELEAKIDELGEDNVAAFVAEPQGAGADHPAGNLLPEIARICRARNILLVADEVICGFSRLLSPGEWFGHQYFPASSRISRRPPRACLQAICRSAACWSATGSRMLINEVGDFNHGHLFRPPRLCRRCSGEREDHRGRAG